MISVECGGNLLDLKAGDKVLLNGTVFTARDKAHRFLAENNFDKIKNSVIYHCGPIVKDNGAIAAGPTTSSRLNFYTPKIIEKYGIKAIIGKGGMDGSVINAMRGKCIYFSAIGGLGVLYADSIRVKGVYKPEFGMTEAIWEFEVKDFPLVVAIDSRGKNIYEDIYNKSKAVFQKQVTANPEQLQK